MPQDRRRPDPAPRRDAGAQAGIVEGGGKWRPPTGQAPRHPTDARLTGSEAGRAAPPPVPGARQPPQGRFRLTWVMGGPARSRYDRKAKTRRQPVSRHDDAPYFEARATAEIRKASEAKTRGDNGAMIPVHSESAGS